MPGLSLAYTNSTLAIVAACVRPVGCSRLKNMYSGMVRSTSFCISERRSSSACHLGGRGQGMGVRPQLNPG
eukprot:scaffold21817_cov56-Isochrysis_galbana.AAC.1